MGKDQKLLRAKAREALENRGYQVEIERGSGGARLWLSKDGEQFYCLVRTSADRAVGWMRHSDGSFKGMDEADLVVVATVDDCRRPTGVEVFGFDPDVVKAAFEDNLAARKAQQPNFKITAPVFVDMDTVTREGPSAVSSNLKASAEWQDELPMAHPRSTSANEASGEAEQRALGDILDHAKAECALLLKLPVDTLALELSVKR